MICVSVIRDKCRCRGIKDDRKSAVIRRVGENIAQNAAKSELCTEGVTVGIFVAMDDDAWVFFYKLK